MLCTSIFCRCILYLLDSGRYILTNSRYSMSWYIIDKVNISCLWLVKECGLVEKNVRKLYSWSITEPKEYKWTNSSQLGESISRQVLWGHHVRCCPFQHVYQWIWLGSLRAQIGLIWFCICNIWHAIWLELKNGWIDQ